MARDLYVAPAGLAEGSNNRFSFWHALPIGETGLDLISVHFNDDSQRDEWEALPGVQIVGNELSAAQIDADIAAILSEVGVDPTMTPKAVRTHIRTTVPHPLF
jgi:hypothetical protein